MALVVLSTIAAVYDTEWAPDSCMFSEQRNGVSEKKNVNTPQSLSKYPSP